MLNFVPAVYLTLGCRTLQKVPEYTLIYVYEVTIKLYERLFLEEGGNTAIRFSTDAKASYM